MLLRYNSEASKWKNKNKKNGYQNKSITELLHFVHTDKNEAEWIKDDFGCFNLYWQKNGGMFLEYGTYIHIYLSIICHFSKSAPP